MNKEKYPFDTNSDAWKELLMRCPTCDGSKVVDCPECGNVGYDTKGEKCIPCEGHGVVKCPKCNGSGIW